MQLGGQHIQHANGAVARTTTGLLDDEAEGIRFV